MSIQSTVTISRAQAIERIREIVSLVNSQDYRHLFPDLPQKGLWFEVIDFNEREYSSTYGWYGFHNGKCVYVCSGISSRFGPAIEAAKEWKQRVQARFQEDYQKRHPIKRNTWGTGSMRQD